MQMLISFFNVIHVYASVNYQIPADVLIPPP